MIVNISPELVSNWIVLLLEDIIVIVGISLAVWKPVFFFAMLGVFCLVAVWLLPKIWRGLKSIFARFFPAKADGSPKVEGPENRGFRPLSTSKNRYLNKVLRAMRRNPLSVAAFYRLEIDNNITVLIEMRFSTGGIRTGCVVLSTIHGPDLGSVRSARWITGVSSQPVAGPK